MRSAAHRLLAVLPFNDPRNGRRMTAEAGLLPAQAERGFSDLVKRGYVRGLPGNVYELTEAGLEAQRNDRS